ALEPERNPAMGERPKACVDEWGGPGGGPGAEAFLPDQEAAHPAPGGVARDPRPVDAPADDGEIKIGHAPDSLPRHHGAAGPCGSREEGVDGRRNGDFAATRRPTSSGPDRRPALPVEPAANILRRA